MHHRPTGLAIWPMVNPRPAGAQASAHKMPSTGEFLFEIETTRFDAGGQRALYGYAIDREGHVLRYDVTGTDIAPQSVQCEPDRTLRQIPKSSGHDGHDPAVIT